MVVKTIATDHQLDNRTSPQQPSKPTSMIEKSYLRSQFERRQKRQLEITNKMHQEHQHQHRQEQQEEHQQQQQQQQQPDSVVRSHELIKRRFFEKLERRESMNSARGTIVGANNIASAIAGATIIASKNGPLEQAQRLHQQQQQFRPIFAGLDRSPTVAAITTKAGTVNESEGAGTDADEAASLETIITTNSKSNGTFAASAPNLCESAAQARRSPPPPLDNSKIDDGQQVDAKKVADTADDRERALQCDSRTTQSAVNSIVPELQEATKVPEQVKEPLLEQQKRQPSKRDLYHGPRPLDQEDAHERLRLLRFEQLTHEQYANPLAQVPDNSQGSQDENDLRGNNTNHDQYDGHPTRLTCSPSAQVLEGMQFGCGNGERINNLIESSLNEHELIEPLLLHEESKMNSDNFEKQEVHKYNSMKHDSCDTAQSRAIVIPSPVDGVLEEDVRSSCSSSGFGASVSAGSSSASSSDGHQHRHRNLPEDDNESVRDCAQNDHYRRPNSLRHRSSAVLEPQSSTGENEISKFEIVVTRNDDSNSTERCRATLSVASNQSYEDSRPLLHVENHGYGSLMNDHQTAVTSIGPTMRNQKDKRRWPLVNANDVSSELDLYSNRQYVNLPAAPNPENQDYSSSAAAAGYATVRNRTLVNYSRAISASSTNIPPTGNNGHSESLSNCDQHASAKMHRPCHSTTCHSELEDRGSCLSGHNSTTSSANTGGFSKLPPVRLIDHQFANNFEFSKSQPTRKPKSPASLMENSNSLQQQPVKKSSSLFKRFGSLVSRAFTSNHPGGEFSSAGRLDHCGNSDHNEEVSGTKSKVKNPQTSPVPPLKEQNLREFSIGSIQESSREHKSMENDIAAFRSGQNDQLGKSADKPDSTQRLILDSNLAKGSKESAKSLIMEADLVILSTKHTGNNHQILRDKNHIVTDAQQYEVTLRSGRDSYASKNCRSRLDDKLLTRAKHCSQNETNVPYCGTKSTRKKSGAYISRRSTSSSCSFYTSLENSSLTSTSAQDLTYHGLLKGGRRRHQRNLKRTGSLSDELKSLVSPSEVGSSEQLKRDQIYLSDKCEQNRAAKLSRRRHSNLDKKHNMQDLCRNNVKSSDDKTKLVAVQHDDLSKSRLIMRWFSTTGSPSLSPTSFTRETIPCGDGNGIRHDSTVTGRESRKHQAEHEPKSLIDLSHANEVINENSKQHRRQKENVGTLAAKEQPISIYTSVHRQNNPTVCGENASKHRGRRRTDEGEVQDHERRVHDDELVVNSGKCQSLNLYQNIMRNYVKRRSHRHHHHHHHRHHHHSHHNRGHSHHAHGNHYHHSKHSSSFRHAHCSSLSNRCGQQQQPRNGESPGRACSCSSEQLAGHGKALDADKAGVWGQLIKINKTDGSQVIELQRAPGRSWGFFVARGAINNKKGKC
jgi:hypothetical protein